MHAVIFDIDGTLLDSTAADDRLYRQAIVEVLGDEVRFREKISDYANVSDTGILRDVLSDNGLDDRQGESVRSRFVALLERHIAAHGPFAVVPGARRLMNQLAASPDYAVGIATGCWRASAVLKLQTAGFDLAGVSLASSDDAVERTAIMEHALRQLGGPIQSVRYYGDGVWDRNACNELGWEFVPVGADLNGLRSFASEWPLQIGTD